MLALADETTYTIGEAADILGISKPTLRVYENHGLVIPQRRKSGHRRYAMSELDRIRRIRLIVHARRFTIETLRDFFADVSHLRPRACMPDESNHLPCWMHPSHTAGD